MGSMSYCRFQNTLSDLRGCAEHMDDELSAEEEEARNDLIQLCHSIACEHYEDGEIDGITNQGGV